MAEPLLLWSSWGHQGLLLGLAAIALVLGAGAVWLYLREHNRRLAKSGLPANGGSAFAPTGATDTGQPAPVLSPWLAAAALVAVGGWIALNNTIDEDSYPVTVPLSNCTVTYVAQREARTTSVLVFEVSADTDACQSMIRNAVLLVDGVPAKDELPFAIDAGHALHRWLVPALAAGRHHIEVVATAGSVAAPLSIEVPPGTQVRGAVNFAAQTPGCATTLASPDGSSKSGQTVAIVVTATCDPKTVAPNVLIDSGTVAATFVSLTQDGKTSTYTWLFKRPQDFPDRVDVVFSRPTSSYSTVITARQPLEIGGVKELLSSLGALIVGLSGLLIALLQYLRGQKVNS